MSLVGRFTRALSHLFRLTALLLGLAAPGLALAAVDAPASTLEGGALGGGTVVIEASSTHLSIQLYYEDERNSRTSYRYFTMLPDVEGAGLGLAWRLAIGGSGPGRGVLPSAARGMAEANWKGQLGGALTPAVSLRYRITVSPSQRDAVVEVFDTLAARYPAMSLPDGGTYASYAQSGIAAMREVLQKAQFRSSITAETTAELFPGPADESSPLNWLYSLMLLNTVMSGNSLDGCRLEHGLKVEEVAGPGMGIGTILGLLREQAPVVGRVVGAGSGLVGAIDGGLPQSVRDFVVAHESAADLMLVGHFDPVMLDILDCEMLQAMRGDDQVPGGIVERSQIYRGFDDWLSDNSSRYRNGDVPRFFRAAHMVTRPLGVGYVDLADIYPVELLREIKPDGWLSWSIGQAGSVFGVPEASLLVDRINHQKLPIYSKRARDTLRSLNVELFKLNRGVMRRLFTKPGRLFDPLGTDNPAMSSFAPAMRFDLRMVVAEQTLIARVLARDGLTEDAALIAELTTASSLLPEVASEKVLRRPDGQRYEHLETIGKVFVAVDKALGGSAKSKDFASLRYRIAIGSAYVFLLHGIDLDKLGPYLKRLWPTLDKRPADAAARTLFDRLNEIRATPDAFPPAAFVPGTPADQFVRGLTAYLEPNGQAWLTCAGADGPTRDLVTPSRVTGRLLGPKDRLAQLESWGFTGPVAAFELLPQNGAIDGALLQPDALSGEICTAIGKRHEALECLLTGGEKATCEAAMYASTVLPAAPGESDHLFMFENSQALRTEVGQLGPYLWRALEGIDPSRADYAKLVDEARAAASEDAREKALLQALVADPAAAVGLGIGLTEADIAKAGEVLASGKLALGEEVDGAFVSDDGAVATLEAALSLGDRADRLAAQRQAVDDVVGAVEGKLLAELPEVDLVDVESALAPVADVLRNDVLPLPTLPDAGSFGFDEIGTGLDVRLNLTGATSDGASLYRASLVYRRPVLGEPATGVTKCTTVTDGQCVTATQVLSSEAGASEDIPLGISVLDVERLSEGGLRATDISGFNNVAFDEEVAREALNKLGLPDFFVPGDLDVRVSEDLRDVTLMLDIDLSGMKTRRIELKLIEGGKAANLANILRAEVEKAIGELDLARNIDALSLPRIDNVAGVWLRPTAEGATLAIDWQGGVLTGSIGYELGYGPATSPALVSGQAELLATTRRIGLRQLTFSDDGLRALSDAVLAGVQLPDEITDVLFVPQYFANKLRFTVSGTFSAAGCAVPVSLQIEASDLAKPADLAAKILVPGRDAVTDLTKCAVADTLTGLAAMVEGRSIGLFGLTLQIVNADDLRSKIIADPGVARADLVLQLDDTCGSGRSGTLAGIVAVAKDNGARLDLSGLNAEANRDSRLLLGSVVECRIRMLIPNSDSVQISDFEVGEGLVSVDVTIKNLPWLGDVPLGRINLAAGAADIGDIVKNAVVATLEARVTSELVARMGETIDLGGVGKINIAKDQTRVSVLGPDAHVFFAGEVEVQGIKATARIKIPFAGLPGSVDVDVDVGDSLLKNVLGVIANQLPFGGENVQIKNPGFERLDGAGYKYGIVFGVAATFGFGDSSGFKIDLQRVVISQSGIKLARQIRMTLKEALEFGYFAINNITVIYDTGSDGGRKGVILEADVAPLASVVSYIIKLSGSLDLRRLSDAIFTLSADLVLLDTLDILLARGEVDLDDFVVKFDTRTSPAISDILDFRGEGEFLGPEAIVRAQSSMAVLGLDLSRDRLVLCVRECEGGEAETMHLTSWQNLLIGEASLTARAKLDLSDIGVGGGVDLDLFGWKPASAALDVNLSSATTRLRFLGINVKVITPTIGLMSPELLIDVLKSLLDIDLKSLLKLKLRDVTVSLMKGSGKVEGGRPGVPGKNGDPGGDRPGGPATYPAAVPDPGVPQDKEPDRVGFNEGFGGGNVPAIYCEKVYGAARGWPAKPADRFELWTPEKRVKSPSIYEGHVHKDVNEFRHWWTFDGDAANTICRDAIDPVRALVDTDDGYQRVGVSRLMGYDIVQCIDNVPSVKLWRLTGDDLENRDKAVVAYKPVLCWDDSGPLHARVTVMRGAGQYWGLVECPAKGLAPGLEEVASFRAACRDRSGLLDLGTLPSADTSRILTTLEEFILLDIRARAILLSGEGRGIEPVTYQVPGSAETGGVLTVSVFDIPGAGDRPQSRRLFMEAENGETRTVTLPLSDPLNDWLDIPGFRDRIFTAWFLSGEKPEVAYTSDDLTHLVLEGDGDKYTWLFSTVPASSDMDSSLVKERQVDIAITADILNGLAGERDVLAGLAPEVVLLPEGGVWQISFGRAAKSGIRLFVMRNGDQLRLLVDLLRRPSGSVATLGDYQPLSRAERRRCPEGAQVLGNILSQLVFGSAPPPNAPDLTQILSNPDAIVTDFVSLAHPLVGIMRQQPCPEPT